MGLFVYFAVPLICTLLFRIVIRQPTGVFFLEGLNAFLPQASAIPAPPPGARTSKRERKLLQRRQLHIKGAQSSVVLQQLSASALNHLSSEPTTFASNFESLGILVFVLFVGVAVHFTLGPLFGLWQDVLLYTLGPLVVVWAALQVLLLECRGSLSRLLGGDQFALLLLGLGAWAAAFMLLAGVPPGWIRWDIGPATKQLDELWNTGMARLLAARMRHYRSSPAPALNSDPTHVAAVLAAVAGLLAAALVGPCTRIAKLYSHIIPVPHWAEKYLKPHPIAVAAVQLALTLPLAVTLYGIVPMADFWRLPPAVAAVLGPALVVAAAMAAVFAVRPLAAAHLGTGLLEWHLLRHDPAGGAAGATASGGASASAAVANAKEVVMRKRLNLVYATVCQVGLQLLAPAAMLVCLALLYGASSGCLDSIRPPQPLIANLGPKPLVLPVITTPPAPPPAPTPEVPTLEGLVEPDAVLAPDGGAPAASAAGTSGGELPPLPPLDFVAFASGFLSWWTCAVMCLFTYPMLFIYRTGLHVG